MSLYRPEVAHLDRNLLEGCVANFRSISSALNELEDKSVSLGLSIDELQKKVVINVGASLEEHLNAYNPHNITKETIGLGNVDNTSDLDKPISNATQEALDDLQDQIDMIKNPGGDGTKFYADDGTFKEISAGGGSSEFFPMTLNGTIADANGGVVMNNGQFFGSIYHAEMGRFNKMRCYIYQNNIPAGNSVELRMAVYRFVSGSTKELISEGSATLTDSTPVGLPVDVDLTEFEIENPALGYYVVAGFNDQTGGGNVYLLKSNTNAVNNSNQIFNFTQNTGSLPATVTGSNASDIPLIRVYYAESGVSELSASTQSLQVVVPSNGVDTGPMKEVFFSRKNNWPMGGYPDFGQLRANTTRGYQAERTIRFRQITGLRDNATNASIEILVNGVVQATVSWNSGNTIMDSTLDFTVTQGQIVVVRNLAGGGNIQNGQTTLFGEFL